MQSPQIILFTSCANPGGMTKTVICDVNQRIREYHAALNFYLTNTIVPIVVVDNSGYDYHDLGYENPSRLEILSFHGNDYDKSLGKGYGEGKIISFALENSNLIHQHPNCFIYKITGRHIVTNIVSILKTNRRLEIVSTRSTIVALKECDNWATSDIFSGPVSFYKSLTTEVQSANDSINRYFEHCLYDNIQKEREAGTIIFFHLPISIKQKGIIGSSGKPLKQIGSDWKYLLKFILYVLHLDLLIRFYNQRIRRYK